MFWVFLILIISIAGQGQSEYGSSCQMPDANEGICVPVKSCKPAIAFFQQLSERGGTISESEREEILQLHCGTFRNVHHVCCLESNVQLNPGGLSVLENQECGFYTTNKVANGHVAAISGYPWMALLVYSGDPDPFKCGGSLITEQYVLTAAHCIRGQESKLTSVRLGEHRKSTEVDCMTLGQNQICAPPVEDVGIAEFIVHPQYRGIFNDIALLRLERKVELQRHIKPICLPIYDDLRSRIHEQYVISGWGKTETGNSSDVLMVALVPRVETATCEAQFKEYRLRAHLDISHLCAGGRGLVDTCKGDSGGPLGYSDKYNDRPRFVQYGIVAAGLTKCGDVDIPGIYTNVSHNLQWITDHIN